MHRNRLTTRLWLVPTLLTFGATSLTQTQADTISPDEIPNLKVWLDAGVGVTESSGEVSAWADQSGQSNDANQIVGVFRPELESNQINALPVIHSEGINFMVIDDFAYNTNAFSYFAVLRFDAVGQTIFSHSTANGSQQAFSLWTQIDGRLRVFVYPDDGGGSAGDPREVLSTTAVPIDTAVLVEVRFDNNNIELGINGELSDTTIAQNNTVNSLLDANSSIGVGTVFNNGPTSVFNGTQFRGDVAEMVFFDSNVTGADRQGIINYFGDRYDITVVPEPGAMSWLLVGIVGGLCRRCRFADGAL